MIPHLAWSQSGEPIIPLICPFIPYWNKLNWSAISLFAAIAQVAKHNQAKFRALANMGDILIKMNNMEEAVKVSFWGTIFFILDVKMA